MDTSQVWAFFSYAWTQTGADEDDCRFFVHLAGIGMADLRAVDHLLFKDICASFAADSLLLLLPEWSYNAADLQQRISRWYAPPVLAASSQPIPAAELPDRPVFGMALSRHATPRRLRANQALNCWSCTTQTLAFLR